MKLFKELNRLGYRHYTDNTIEELDDLPLNATERIMEQALVLRWFRENYQLIAYPQWRLDSTWDMTIQQLDSFGLLSGQATLAVIKEVSYEKAELAVITKLIGIVKETCAQG